MIIQLAQGIEWDTEKQSGLQSLEAQVFIQDIIDYEPPVEEEREPCLGNNSRPLTQLFQINKVQISVTYNYIADAMSNEWAGLENQIINIQEYGE